MICAIAQPPSTSSVASLNTLKNAALCTDTSVTANLITCTTAVGFTGYADGQSVDVLLANSVNAAATINVNGLGAKAITFNGLTVMVSGVMAAGGTYRLQYDGTEFVLQGSVNLTSGSVTPSGYQPNQTLQGCGVEYISGLVFNVGACTYTINGQTYSSPITAETLGAADPTNPRIDVIGVNNSNVVFVSAGTPAATPQQPTIDPSTQLGLTFVYIPANATTPQGITLGDIYEENTEWTSSVTANFNAASTNNPFRGTKDIEATTAVFGNSVTLVKPAAGTENLTTWNNLVFYIRSKATWPSGNGSGANGARVVNVFWLSGATQIGTAVVLRDGVFGFSSSNTTAYQQITIPTSLFGTGSTTVTSVKFQVAGNGGTSSIGFYLDAITLQGGGGIISLPATLMNFKGTWSSATAYNVYDTVVSGGIGYVALVANTNVAVGTASTWAPLAPASSGGTVTSVGTTSPITGGTITGAGTIACATCTVTIASGAKALATSAISSATCSSAQTDTATGTATTDGIIASFNGDPTAVTGYVPLTTGMLTIIAYPTSNTVNFKVCNNTGSSITPGAITINWRVVR